MELALNLIWVCVALFGCALLHSNLSRASGHPAGRTSNRQKIIAMGCALIILFFVISMTDDLHDQEIFVEESKFLRMMGGSSSPLLAAAHSTVARPFLLFFGFFRSSFTFALPVVRRLLEPLEVSFTAAIDCDQLSGRAPPASLA
jgi:hypothetical protein